MTLLLTFLASFALSLAILTSLYIRINDPYGYDERYGYRGVPWQVPIMLLITALMFGVWARLTR